MRRRCCGSSFSSAREDKVLFMKIPSFLDCIVWQAVPGGEGLRRRVDRFEVECVLCSLGFWNHEQEHLRQNTTGFQQCNQSLSRRKHCSEQHSLLKNGCFQELLQELFPESVGENCCHLVVRDVHQLIDVVEPGQEGDERPLPREVLMVLNRRHDIQSATEQEVRTHWQLICVWTVSWMGRLLLWWFEHCSLVSKHFPSKSFPNS